MTNFFSVGRQGDKVRILNLPAIARGLTEDEAVSLAAWLVILALKTPLDVQKEVDRITFKGAVHG